MDLCSPCFCAGIDKKAAEFEIPEDARDAFMDVVLTAVAERTGEIKAAMDMGLVKAAEINEADLCELDKLLLKAAQDPATFEKSAVIRQESCTDSKGNAGSWVLYDSAGQKKLGCHGSRESAEAQERAIQAHKGATVEPKEADMRGSPVGRKGRIALAQRFLEGGSFEHEKCTAAMKDEGVDNPDAFCRALSSLVGREREATRGPREGKIPGE